MRSTRAAIPVAVFFALAQFAGPVARADGAKKAAAQALQILEDGANAGKKQLKHAVAGDFDALVSQIKDLEQAAKTNGSASAGSLANALAAFEINLRDALDDVAAVAFADAMQNALIVASAGGLAFADLPIDFFYGSDKIAYQYRRDVDEIVAKEVAKASGRVEKTAKIYQKHGAELIACELATPHYLDPLVATFDEKFAARDENFIAVAVSGRSATEADGAIIVEGRASTHDANVDVVVTSITGSDTVPTPLNTDGSFLYIAGGISPGMFAITVRPTGGEHSGGSRVAIALR